MDYFQYVIRLTNESGAIRQDMDYGAVIPAAIDYAEQRIYRDLDILNSRVVSTTTTIASSGRSITLSTASGTFIVVESISAVSSAGTRSAMSPVTKEWIDAVYPNTSTSYNSAPKWFAPITDQLFLVAPPADGAYNMEVIGTVRPSPLSSANSSTFLTRYCPDLFLAASLIYLSDDNRRPFWEDQYSKLVATAADEQLRQRYEGAAWTPMENSNVSPPRV